MIEVIRFTASWCGPCRMYKPQFEKAQTQLREAGVTNLEFTTVDVDDDPNGLSAEYGVRNIPFTAFIKDGSLVSHQVGVLSATDLVEKVQSL